MKTGNTFLWFYYDNSGRKIDAIFREKRGYSGIEVKYRRKVDERDVNRIPTIRKYFILSKEDVEHKKNKMIVPADIFLALLPISEKNI